jgi:DNA-directed RNA polymerase
MFFAGSWLPFKFVPSFFLNRILRQEFVRIYSEPVLQKFLDEQRQAHPDVDLPEPPESGNLDIRQVIESPYFFA